MEQKENLLEQELLLTVVLPEGVEKTTMVHGRSVNQTVLYFYSLLTRSPMQYVTHHCIWTGLDSNYRISAWRFC